MALEVLIKKLPGAEDIPAMRYMTEHAAGLDIYAALAEPVVLAAGETKLIPTGFQMALPPGYEAQVRPRSGLALKKNIGILNAPGTIDADYRGEVGVILTNFGKEPFTVQRGERIAQLVIAPVAKAELKFVAELPESERGAGGFGSTGGSGELKEPVAVKSEPLTQSSGELKEPVAVKSEPLTQSSGELKEPVAVKSEPLTQNGGEQLANSSKQL